MARKKKTTTKKVAKKKVAKKVAKKTKTSTKAVAVTSDRYFEAKACRAEFLELEAKCRALRAAYKVAKETCDEALAEYREVVLERRELKARQKELVRDLRSFRG